MRRNGRLDSGGAMGAVALVVGVMGAVAARAEEVVFLDMGSQWKYLPGLAEASSPDPTSWRQLDFDDGGWASGVAPFGYGGADELGTDLAALDPPMRNNYSSLYLRATFELADRELVEGLVARVAFDDGFTLAINGVEVARDNLPGDDGDVMPHDTTALRSHSSRVVEEFAIENFADILVTGTNIVALQGFNVSLTNTDFRIDLQIADPLGPDVVAPRVARVIPVPGSTVRALTQIEILFDEEVIGLEASDLLVNDRAATSVTGGGAGPYLFAVGEPPPGEVRIAWAADHAITDTAPPRNAFAGDGWTYTLDPNAPPPTLAITEVLAANGNGLVDRDGDTEDWIEVFNQGTTPVSALGWSLTDDPEEPGLWVFPDVVIGPGEFLVVFASGKDRVDGGEIHANFKLRDSGGEYLGLYSAESPRRMVSEFTPELPPQRFDYSYGPSATGEPGYFEVPTPGEPNGEGQVFPGFVFDPDFSVDHGFHAEPFALVLSSRTPAARIFYTLDGSLPTPETGTLYDGAIDIAPPADRGLVAVRAVAHAEGLLPSRVVTRSYVFPNAVLRQTRQPDGFPSTWPGTSADYALDPRIIARDPDMAVDGLLSIPTLSIVTDVAHLFDARTGIYAHPANSGFLWERPTSAELIHPDGRSGFQVDCGIRTQGGSSVNNWKSKKVSLRLAFRGDYGARKLEYPLFPGYRVDRFDTLILDASLNLVWNHPDGGQQNQAQYVRDQFVADLQNEAGGHAPRGIFVNLYLNGLYWGQYGVHERPDASFAAENFGGEKEEYDAIKHQPGRVVDGDPLAFNLLMTRGAAVVTPEQYAALGEILDIPGFADYMLINFWAGNTDWMHQNWYATRKRVDGAQWLFHSWDAEHVLKSVSENKINESRGPAAIFQALRRNPEFLVLFGDLVHRHFFNGGMLYVDPQNQRWDEENPDRNRPAALYMERIEEISTSIHMESARWGDVARPGSSYTRDDWMRELNRLQSTYFTRRSDIVFNQFRTARLYPTVEAPVFNRHGGEVAPGFALTMTLPAGARGEIYFTLDGADPRFPGGAIAPSAAVYEGPIAIGDFTVVRARNLDGSSWSALNEATFTRTGSSPRLLRITEIMYNPVGGSEYEFVEIHNPVPMDVTIALAGVAFTNGIDFTFPANAALAPGRSLVIVANPDAFAERYPGVPIGGVFRGQLANGGEKLTLSDGDGETIVSVDYDDGDFWPLAPDGFGRSLVLADPEIDPDDSRAWRASAAAGGSPGEVDPRPAHGPVLVGEVLAGPGGFVELVNLGDSAVDVGGWYLSPLRDDEDALKAARIAAGSSVPAGGLTAFAADDLGFAIDSSGGEIFLASADAAGQLDGLIVGVGFGASRPGVSFGLHETSTGIDLAPLSAPTPGAENAAPLAAEVAINEVHYNPLDGEVEFVELFHPGAAPHDLSGWRLNGVLGLNGVDDFTFAAGTSIPGGGFLLVAPVDPVLFRALHDVPAGVPVIGAYAGALDNSGERLSLFRRTAGALSADIPVDMVRYNDRAPWPLEPDGGGNTLERIRADEYGNEVLNWAASKDAGGTPGRHNSVSPPIDPGEGGRQVPGDLTQDGRLNITDPVALLNHLFRNDPAVLPCAGGTIGDEGNRRLLDSNGDARVAMADAIHMLNYLFLGGPAHTLGTECVPIVGCPGLCAVE